MKQEMAEIEGDIHNSTVILRDFNTPLSVRGKTTTRSMRN